MSVLFNLFYARKKKVAVPHRSIWNEQQNHEKKETTKLRLDEKHRASDTESRRTFPLL